MRNSPSDQFVNAVHRRLMLLNTLEQIGRGLFIASIVACALIGIAIWQSMPTAPILLFCESLGLLIGCGFAAYRWPTRLMAATQTDRQLRLDDLLTTALFSAPVASDDFHKAVAAMADARCRVHSPSEVVLRQLGMRSWSGIGVAMAIAATLAVIPLRPSQSQAIDANLSVLSANTSESSGSNESLQSHGPILPANNPIDETASSNSMIADQPAKPTGSAAHQSPTTPESGNTAGANGGSSATAAKSQQAMRTADAASQTPSPNDTTAGGGNALASNSGHGESTGGKATASSAISTPAWTGNAPPDGQTSTPFAEDRIPAEDRDLVREFFKPRQAR